jgi:hypothetical protein
MLAEQAPTGSPETMLAEQAPTGSPETICGHSSIHKRSIFFISFLFNHLWLFF